MFLTIVNDNLQHLNFFLEHEMFQCVALYYSMPYIS